MTIHYNQSNIEFATQRFHELTRTPRTQAVDLAARAFMGLNENDWGRQLTVVEQVTYSGLTKLFAEAYDEIRASLLEQVKQSVARLT